MSCQQRFLLTSDRSFFSAAFVCKTLQQNSGCVCGLRQSCCIAVARRHCCLQAATTTRPLGISGLQIRVCRNVRFLRQSLDIGRPFAIRSDRLYVIVFITVIELFLLPFVDWHSTCLIPCGSGVMFAEGHLPTRDCECIHGNFRNLHASSLMQVRLSDDSCSRKKHEQQGLLKRARSRHLKWRDYAKQPIARPTHVVGQADSGAARRQVGHSSIGDVPTLPLCPRNDN